MATRKPRPKQTRPAAPPPATEIDPAALRTELERLGAPRRAVESPSVMLAEARDRPFDDPAWIFEIKYDGFRLVASKSGGQTRLTYRSARDNTAIWPEVVEAVSALKCDGVVLDGEIVVVEPSGRTSFTALQQRAQLRNPLDVRRESAAHPCTYVVFDVLALEGFDLRPLPLSERKRLLRQIVPREGRIVFAEYLPERGTALYDEVAQRGLEGIMAKRADAPYRAGRSTSWLKIPLGHRAEFAIVGFTDPEGSRAGLGALNLAVREGDGFLYAGDVGSGFTEKQLLMLRKELDRAIRSTAPCYGTEMPKGRRQHWVEPRLVCEVRYREWPEGGHLRFPVFMGLRPDKSVDECLRTVTSASVEEVPPAPKSSDRRELVISHPEKVFWPDERITKGDLIEYYRAIAPWMLPYLRDRPVMLTRYPDGIKGKSFFQKDAPPWVPDWIRRVKMYSEDTQRDIAQFVCDDEASLLYLANLGTIPFHIWSSRVASIEKPDWCVLDLDPKGAPFADVVRVAHAIHQLCEEIELPSFAKTSGSTGLHVLIPLGRQLTHAQSVQLGELMARIVAAELSDIATVIRLPQDRGGRVYVDFLQNGAGKLIAAPFCARPVPGATVSTPLKWSEVSVEHPLSEFTVRTVPERMKKLKRDPMAGVLEEKPDVAAAVGKLAARVKT